MKYISKIKSSRRKNNIFIFFILLILGLVSFFPVYLTVTMSFKPVNELFIFPPKPYTFYPTMENYRDMFRLIENLWVPFSRYLFNTIFVTVTVTVSQCILCSMAGFVLSKGSFKGKKLINSIIVISLLYQNNVIYIMQYILMSKLNLIDTYASLILPYAVTPLGFFLMRQSISRTPDAVIEAARTDGADMFQIWRYIIIPDNKPALMTLVIFSFQSTWNMTGENFIRSEAKKTLAYAVNQAGNSGIYAIGASMACSVIMLIPPALIFMIAQQKVMETMSYSGIKE